MQRTGPQIYWPGELFHHWDAQPLTNVNFLRKLIAKVRILIDLVLPIHKRFGLHDWPKWANGVQCTLCIVCVLIKNCNSVWRGSQITQQDAALQKLRIMSAPASLFLQHQWPPVKRLQSANFAMPLFLPVIITVWCRVFQESPTNVQTTDEQANNKQKNKQATWTDKQKHTNNNNMNKQTIKTHKQHEQPNKNTKQKKQT